MSFVRGPPPKTGFPSTPINQTSQRSEHPGSVIPYASFMKVCFWVKFGESYIKGKDLAQGNHKFQGQAKSDPPPLRLSPVNHPSDSVSFTWESPTPVHSQHPDSVIPDLFYQPPKSGAERNRPNPFRGTPEWWFSPWGFLQPPQKKKENGWPFPHKPQKTTRKKKRLSRFPRTGETETDTATAKRNRHRHPNRPEGRGVALLGLHRAEIEQLRRRGVPRERRAPSAWLEARRDEEPHGNRG